MPTMILARHGRTTANTAGVLAGRSRGVHLDDVGAQQAVDAGSRLAGLPLAAVVTSPMERCRETAAALTRAATADGAGGKPAVHRDKGLTECDYGEWTGRELRTLAKEPMWRTVQAHPSAAVFPGGESMADMAARAVATVRSWDARVADEHGDDAVWVAVSHGDVIKAVLADALGLHLDSFQRIVVDPGSLSVVRYTSLRPFVVSSNTTSGSLAHLAPRKKGRRRRSAASARAASDAVVGGGAGAGG